MPRGRQYYDPEIQVSRPVEAPADLSRIEFYPELDGSGQIGRWIARRIDHDGRIIGYTKGSFDHDAELAHAMELWPDLTVFELDDAQKDSTWEGTGPSPRIWQVPTGDQQVVPSRVVDSMVAAISDEVTPVLDEESLLPQVPLHMIRVDTTGAFILLDDLVQWIEVQAVAYEVDKNPSAALALRDAVDALKDIG